MPLYLWHHSESPKNRSFGNQNKKTPLQVISPICWNFLDPFYICDIQKNIFVLANSLFLGVQFNFVFGGIFKILHSLFGHHVYDFMCFSSPEKGRRSLRSSCRQRGRWRAHEQVHWTRYTLNNSIILDQINFSFLLCEKSWMKSSTLE